MHLPIFESGSMIGGRFSKMQLVDATRDLSPQSAMALNACLALDSLALLSTFRGSRMACVRMI